LILAEGAAIIKLSTQQFKVKRWCKFMRINQKHWLGLLAAFVPVLLASWPASGQQQQAKPNIIMIVSDDFGYGDSAPYGGGPGRGMPTPSLERLANEGMTFFSFYAQPSCTPGRAAMQTGRIPNRSGMTTVAFQGQGGELPAAEWTLGSVLKQAGYQTFFSGKRSHCKADEDVCPVPAPQAAERGLHRPHYHLEVPEV
jgi:arylsulfatase A-like enzyme